MRYLPLILVLLLAGCGAPRPPSPPELLARAYEATARAYEAGSREEEAQARAEESQARAEEMLGQPEEAERIRAEAAEWREIREKMSERSGSAAEWRKRATDVQEGISEGENAEQAWAYVSVMRSTAELSRGNAASTRKWPAVSHSAREAAWDALDAARADSEDADAPPGVGGGEGCGGCEGCVCAGAGCDGASVGNGGGGVGTVCVSDGSILIFRAASYVDGCGEQLATPRLLWYVIPIWSNRRE